MRCVERPARLTPWSCSPMLWIRQNPGTEFFLPASAKAATPSTSRLRKTYQSSPGEEASRVPGEQKNHGQLPQVSQVQDLIQTEMGIRAEAPTQTAMTVLWRKRKMLLGLVGEMQDVRYGSVSVHENLRQS